jgi:iron complex transport system ATP-binding protein
MDLMKIPVLEAQSVRLSFGSRLLLDDVNLRVESGRVTALLGPNGAGKSTLLKVMAGSLRPSSGSIRLGGIPLHDWDPLECARQRAVLTQDTHLPFAFTVREVALMGRYPHARHHETKRDEDTVDRCLKSSDTYHLADRLFPTLSGGEKQRTHWARVLSQLDAFEPDLTPDGLRGCCALLDEPTSSLDLGHQHTMLDRARRLASFGAGVLIVLHDLNLAAQYADEIAVLHAGRIAAIGTPDHVLTPSLLHTVYGINARVFPHPDNGKPQVYVTSHRAQNPAASRPLPLTNHQPVLA